jgi:hypothetical protein
MTSGPIPAVSPSVMARQGEAILKLDPQRPVHFDVEQYLQ